MNNWDKLNVMLSYDSCECFFADICTMNGTTIKKVVLQSYEEQGLIGLFASLTLPLLYVFVHKYNL